ncbi:CLPTM1-domain-containing protein [Anaeromyces robustus]|uniref:CLPTM1-domain-containing protein n=1 Tax=Anaeromyces robustus TaxID=1754192 RepID=A0A1Y1XMC7_9FUNG|nr:CLPTM1-domain-containing protein [Anaeromyces robustus]|eukprot:ORX86897.1 CLPTM1-domain-containing protein [Anaeromyces robustus]
MVDKNNENKKVDAVQQKQEQQQEQQQQQQQQRQEPENKSKLKELLPAILRMVFFFALYKIMTNVAQNKLNNQSSTKQPPQFVGKNDNQNPDSKVLPNQNENNFIVRNLWKTNENTKTDLYVYLSENEIFSEFNDESKLLWNINDIKYHDYNVNYDKEFKVKLPESVLNNGTYYLHSFLTFSGVSPNPQNSSFDRKKITYNKKCKIKYI